MSLISRKKFNTLVSRHKGDYKVQDFTSLRNQYLCKSFDKPTQEQYKKRGKQLGASSKAAILVWKKLSRCIIKSIAPADEEAASQQAGSAHYAKAAKSHFGEISVLITAGKPLCNKIWM